MLLTSELTILEHLLQVTHERYVGPELAACWFPLPKTALSISSWDLVPHLIDMQGAQSLHTDSLCTGFFFDYTGWSREI